MKLFCRNPFVLAALICFCFWVRSAQANVYATDIKLNGSLGATVILPGQGVAISYVLNDTATGGVWIQIDSGTNVIATLSSTNGAAGTNAGLNTVDWDGLPDNSTNLAEGIYTVSITAASTGYCTWTNITDDSSNFQITAPRGIAVDQNTNSPYYGRVYVANALNMYETGTSGIFKCNADGSPADEGGFSTGGYDWGNSGFAPWKMVMGTDDRLYVNDFTDRGVVLSFDPIVDANGVRDVLDTGNYLSQHPDAYLGGLALTDDNTQIWMADINVGDSAGILGWQLTSNGVVATNDTGTTIVPTEQEFLAQAPFDLALDTNDFIYAVQFNAFTNDSAIYGLLGFPQYDGIPVTSADWAVALYPELVDVYGVAIDPTASLAAVAVLGRNNDPESHESGGLYLLSARTGQLLADIDQTGGDGYFGVAWDRVGNLYALDGSDRLWRAYSPPGTNQATTVAVPVIQAYDEIVTPTLVTPTDGTNQMRFTLAGQSYITYVIQRSCDFTNWTYVLTSYSANSNRCISVPICGTQNFYRAMTVPP